MPIKPPEEKKKTTRRVKTEAEAACQKVFRVNETSPTIPKRADEK